MTSVCSEQNNVTWTARPQDELRNPIKHTDSVEKISTSLNQSQHVTGIKSQTDRRLSFICIFSICFMNSPWRWGGRFGTPSMVGVWFAKGERERGGDEVSRREERGPRYSRHFLCTRSNDKKSAPLIAKLPHPRASL
jgi:hypothetical protein